MYAQENARNNVTDLVLLSPDFQVRLLPALQVVNPIQPRRPRGPGATSLGAPFEQSHARACLHMQGTELRERIEAWTKARRQREQKLYDMGVQELNHTLEGALPLLVCSRSPVASFAGFSPQSFDAVAGTSFRSYLAEISDTIQEFPEDLQERTQAILTKEPKPYQLASMAFMEAVRSPPRRRLSCQMSVRLVHASLQRTWHCRRRRQKRACSATFGGTPSCRMHQT